MLIEPLCHGRQISRSGLVVGIENQEVVALCRANANVHGGRRTSFGTGVDDAYRGHAVRVGEGDIRRAVGRSIVGDDDLPFPAPFLCCDPVELVGKSGRTVQAGYDD